MHNTGPINAIIGEIKRKHKLRFNKEVAILLEMEEPTLSNILAGRKPIGKNLRKLLLSEKFNVKENFLDTGEGAMFESEDDINANDEGQDKEKKYNDGVPVKGDLIEIRVPLVQAFAYGGYLSGYGDAEYLDTLPYLTMTADKERKGNYMAFEVRNDSMTSPSGKTFNEGDRVIGREVSRNYWRNKFHMKQWRFFVIVTKTDGILIKEMIAHDTASGKITLHSLNPEYKDFEVNLDDVAQIFNVIERREKM